MFAFFHQFKKNSLLKFNQINLDAASLKLATHKFHQLFEHGRSRYYLYQATETRWLDMHLLQELIDLENQVFVLMVYEGQGTLVYDKHLVDYEAGQLISFGPMSKLKQINPLTKRVILLFHLFEP